MHTHEIEYEIRLRFTNSKHRMTQSKEGDERDDFEYNRIQSKWMLFRMKNVENVDKRAICFWSICNGRLIAFIRLHLLNVIIFHPYGFQFYIFHSILRLSVCLRLLCSFFPAAMVRCKLVSLLVPIIFFYSNWNAGKSEIEQLKIRQQTATAQKLTAPFIGMPIPWLQQFSIQLNCSPFIQDRYTDTVRWHSTMLFTYCFMCWISI